VPARRRAPFRRPAAPAIAATGTGFPVGGGAGPRVTVDRAAGRRVAAYERDLYATDCVITSRRSSRSVNRDSRIRSSVGSMVRARMTPDSGRA
jgi:hypothetical protein